MNIGEKIKLARKLRGITQKELGFLAKLTDVRIRQYETNHRTPKDSQLQVIARALGIPIDFFCDFNLDTPNKLMQMLFELELTKGLTLQQIDDNNGDPAKYALVFEDHEMNRMLGHWYRKIEKMKSLKQSDINDETKETIENDYLEWKIRYPESMLDETANELRIKQNELATKRLNKTDI